VGKYREALDTLIHAESLNATGEGRPMPADLAILAMAQYRLGQKDQARATLDRLRKAMQQSAWTKDKEANALLQEAEQLIQDDQGEFESFGPKSRNRIR
jgi:hypothetical protein